MKHTKPRIMLSAAWMLLLAAAAVAGCATRSAPDMKGRWQAVNRFPDKTEAIPLDPPHTFYATAKDATLKALLVRWAEESDRTLLYLHPNNFTLHAPVAGIRTDDLRAATMSLTAAYANQGVFITVDEHQIAVRAQDPSKEKEATPRDGDNQGSITTGSGKAER